MADMTRINANLPTKLVTIAKHYANLNGMTLTELIRNGLKEHLISQGKQAQQMTINMQAAPVTTQCMSTPLPSPNPKCNRTRTDLWQVI